MIFKKLTVQGVLSYKKKVFIDFSNIDIALVVGQILGDTTKSNGSGKSSLFECIPICLFGKIGSRSSNLDDLINYDSKQASIEFIFELDGIIYKKIRKWGTKKQNEFYSLVGKDYNSEDKLDWKTVTDDDKKSTDVLVEETLGLNEKLLFNTVYLKQKGELLFIDGKSSDRKQIFMDLINLAIYARAEKEAKNKIADLEILLQVNEARYEDNKVKVEEKDKIILLIKEKNENLVECNESIQKAKENIKIHEQQILILEKIENLRVKLQSAKEEHIELLKEKKELIEDKQDRIEYFESKKLAKVKLIDESKELEKKAVDDVSDKLLEKNKEIDKQNIDLGVLKTKLNKNETLVEQIDEKIEKSKKLTSKLLEFSKQLEGINEKLLELPILEKKITSKQQELDGIKVNLEVCKEEKNKKEIILGQLVHKIIELNEINGKCPILSIECKKIDSIARKKLLDDNNNEINIITGKKEKLEELLRSFIDDEKVVKNEIIILEKQKQEIVNNSSLKIRIESEIKELEQDIEDYKKYTIESKEALILENKELENLVEVDVEKVKILQKDVLVLNNKKNEIENAKKLIKRIDEDVKVIDQELDKKEEILNKFDEKVKSI